MFSSSSLPLRIGTRGSPLAIAQAEQVASALRAAHGWDEAAVQLVPITTSGDRIQDRSLADLGGKALWTKELDSCLADGRTDLSVHSMKDVETIRNPAFHIIAMLPRADTSDRLIGAERLEDLPTGARVGTSSPRRTAQLLARRPDLDVQPIRGNVQTRLAKLESGEFDATLLASAGLDRLGLGEVGFALDDWLPAPSQGAIGVEIRSDDKALSGVLAPIDDPATSRAVAAERALLAELGGDCRSAVAALAQCGGGRLRIRAEILLPDGSEVRSGECEYDVEEDDGQAAALARSLLAAASPALRGLFAG